MTSARRELLAVMVCASGILATFWLIGVLFRLLTSEARFSSNLWSGFVDWLVGTPTAAGFCVFVLLLAITALPAFVGICAAGGIAREGDSR